MKYFYIDQCGTVLYCFYLLIQAFAVAILVICSHIFDLLYDGSLVRIDFKKGAQAVQARSSLFEAVGLASYTGDNGQCPRPSTPLPAPQPLPEGYYACG